MIASTKPLSTKPLSEVLAEELVPGDLLRFDFYHDHEHTIVYGHLIADVTENDMKFSWFAADARGFRRLTLLIVCNNGEFPPIPSIVTWSCDKKQGDSVVNGRWKLVCRMKQ